MSIIIVYTTWDMCLFADIRGLYRVCSMPAWADTLVGSAETFTYDGMYGLEWRRLT